MKDITTYLINEGKDLSIQTTKNLIEALKAWYNEGAGEGKGSNSPYIKIFEQLISDFIKECIMSPDMPEEFKDKVCDEYKLKGEDYDSCTNELIKYVLK